VNEEKTKSFAVSKQMVYDSYLKVCDKNGSAGIDKKTIEIVLIPYKLERFLILISSEIGFFRRQ